MKIDNNLVESLLYEEEGVELDFKRDQYNFVKAEDEEKSELLKDILAFANAWRRSDAFILLGVLEVKGGRSEVVGISELLDDASIQQFINNKTNRPVNFSYRSLQFEDKKIALLHIPVQPRPLYLKKDFGKLKKETVYIRRGSTTEIASLDEISKMGTQTQIDREEPVLEVSFADPKSRTRLPNEQTIISMVLETPKADTIPDYKPERQPQFSAHMSQVNYSYYKDLVKFTKVSRLVSPLSIVVCNSGVTTAQDVRIEMKISKKDKSIFVLDYYKYPSLPVRERNTFDLASQSVARATIRCDVNVSSVGDFWIVEARADKVQPKAYYWFEFPFYLGGTQSCQVPIEITIYSDELSTPKQQELLVSVQSEQKSVDLEGVIELEKERFRSSEEFQKILRMHKAREEQATPNN